MPKVDVVTASAAGGRRMVVLGRLAKRIAFTGLVGLVAACGHGFQAQSARLASSEAAIRSAKELDAQGDERTALLVQLAEEEVAIAKNMMNEGDTRRVDLLLERAKADAELAMMLTRENVAKADARKARQILDAKTGGD